MPRSAIDTCQCQAVKLRGPGRYLPITLHGDTKRRRPSPPRREAQIIHKISLNLFMRYRFKMHTTDLPLVVSVACFWISASVWKPCWCSNETWLQLTP